MKRIFALLTVFSLICVLAACGGTGVQGNLEQLQSSQEENQPGSGTSSPQSTPSTDPAPDESETVEGGGEPKVLVAFFSATGNTAGVAQHIQTVLDAELFEIVPEVPYTDTDLNYSSDNCRANQEQNDPDARPAISGTLENPDSYDVVFLGYPIWWGQAPKILYTFLESYDFGGATIVPFCTSGSSGIGSSATDLHTLAPDANWLSGQRFSGSASESTVASWVEGLDFSDSSASAE